MNSAFQLTKLIIAYPIHPRLSREEGMAVVGRRSFIVRVSREKGPAVKNGGLLGAGPLISPPLSREGVAAVIGRGSSIAPLLSPPLSREGGGGRCCQGVFPSFVEGGGDSHRHQGITHCWRRRRLLSKGGSGNIFCAKAQRGPVAGTARRQRCNDSSGLAPSPSKNQQIHSALTAPDAKNP
jgi:hypothetical protein